MRYKQNSVPAPSVAGLFRASRRYGQRFAKTFAGHMRGKACHDIKAACAWLFVALALLLGACAPDVTRHNNAGNELFATGTYDEALSEYRQAQVNDPDVAEPYYNAANALNRQGNLEGAEAQTGQALKTADPNLAARTWYNLGNAFFDAETWGNAIAAYQAALRIDPDDVDAKRNLELALQKKNDEQQQEQQDNQDSQQGEQSQQSETSPETATPTPSGTEQDKAGQQSEQPAQEAQAQDQGTDSLTPEQARQMFEALVGDGETLQERLQKTFRVPGAPPERDW